MTTGSTLRPEQHLALAAEAEAAVKLTRQGIAALWRIDGGNDFVHLPLQLLSQGFERLVKLTYAMALLKQHGRLPQGSTFKGRRGYGHDLVRLTDDLIKLVEKEPDYAARPAVQEDLRLIRSDSDLRRLLRLLTTFGSWSRYFRFEEFLDPDAVRESEDPDREWQSIESDVLQREPDSLELLRSGEAYAIIASYVTRLLDEFARAIVRMWTLGAVHPDAKAYLGVIKEFLFLRDEDLGKQREG